ncbi:sugar phosphate isomerase/epimerase [bacterium]|nr:MAG: sugar phosphate isomerase/epimerase [bacterium]
MQKALSPSAIGVKAPTIEAAAEAARLGGFVAVEISPKEVVERGVEASRQALGGIAVAGFGVPFDWRGEESAWKEGLDALPEQAKAMAALGCRRCSTWIMPMSDERDYASNREFHVSRLRPIAQALAAEGITFGLEYVGPKTLWSKGKYPFAHTMREMLELGREVGPNVGLLFDAWHWYTSHETLDDIRALKPEQVVYVHVNDAPAGLDVDEQVDHTRALPGETGVIDLSGVLKALKELGYDGPVVCEPFKKELNELPDDAARLKAVGDAMDRMFEKAGIGS